MLSRPSIFPRLSKSTGAYGPGESHTDTSDLPTSSIHDVGKKSMQSRKSKNQNTTVESCLMQRGDPRAEIPRSFIFQDSRLKIAVNAVAASTLHTKPGQPRPVSERQTFACPQTTHRGIWVPELMSLPENPTLQGMNEFSVYMLYVFGNFSFEGSIMWTSIIQSYLTHLNTASLFKFPKHRPHKMTRNHFTSSDPQDDI